MTSETSVFETRLQQSGLLDLRQLALPHEDPDSFDEVSFCTRSYFRIKLVANEDTQLKSGLVTPLEMTARTDIVDTNIFVTGLMAGLAVVNTVRERPRFPKHGAASLVAATVRQGDRLTINGHKTPPVVAAFTSKRLPSDSYEHVKGYKSWTSLSNGEVVVSQTVFI